MKREELQLVCSLFENSIGSEKEMTDHQTRGCWQLQRPIMRVCTKRPSTALRMSTMQMGKLRSLIHVKYEADQQTRKHR
jgi:hypothetical protein